MARAEDYAALTVVSSHVRSVNDHSILVEAGGFAPTKWFLEHGLHPSVDDVEEPLSKRQRTMTKSSRRGFRHRERMMEPISARARKLDPKHHVPVSRISIDLHFPESILSKDMNEKAIKEDIELEGNESVMVLPAWGGPNTSDAPLRLALPGYLRAMLYLDISDTAHPAVKRLSRMLHQFRDSLTGWDLPKTGTRLVCTLTPSKGQLFTVVRFEATLYCLCTAFIPAEHLALLFPQLDRPAASHDEAWDPQDFYENVHVTDKIEDVTEDLSGTLMTELYPFQKRAVHWMLRREGVRIRKGIVESVSEIVKRQDRLDFWDEATDTDGGSVFVSFLQGRVRRERSGREDGADNAGILAEEMGLGKTIEIVALMCLHGRPASDLDRTITDEASGGQLKPSGATLVITPPAILQQWKSELRRHAPKLRVLHYEGVSTKKDAPSEQQNVADMSEHYDIVLTTYQTLKRELHFAVEPPARDMRRSREYPRPRSPLVLIHWWRVCLDEAQMVEKGVSAAAQVASRLPRVNSWAVSGTPMKKNVQDLEGLLLFLNYQPLPRMSDLWSVPYYKPYLQRIFQTLALRHTKANIREELDLPPQKRIVLTIPFSAVEQQHYTTLFSQMAEEIGLNSDGSPRDPKWDPSDRDTLAKMRTWLVRLRQTCLHPQVGGQNRRALGRGQAALRTVEEVLSVMIDQNESSLRTEERKMLMSSLTSAHMIGNAGDDEHRSEKALKIYLAAQGNSVKMVAEARARLQTARQQLTEKGELSDQSDEDSEESASEATSLTTRLLSHLRTALQLQHACTFYAATAYHQIKSNETLVEPDSTTFKQYDEKETTLYEEAKMLRKEILKETSRKAETQMRKIADLKAKNRWSDMPGISNLDDVAGIESRRLVDKSDELFEVIRQQVKTMVKWRAIIAEYLLKPLVDDDKSDETTGEEYEDSTKLQDELHAYFDGINAIHADLNTFITGEDAPLIDHEVKDTIKRCKAFLDSETLPEYKALVHAPELTLQLMDTRNTFRRRKDEVGSVRGLVHEARGLESTLQSHAVGGRAAEHEIVQRHLHALQAVFTSYSKALNGFGKELELFRSTHNLRINFYRRLQDVSDDVIPYKDGQLDPTLDLTALQAVTAAYELQEKSWEKLKTKNRFLLHLRDENGAQTEAKICVICQSSFENGVLTVCGHQYCKECINHWWSAHHTCPVCKQKLKLSDFHNITYKPSQLKAQEETNPTTQSTSKSASASNATSIYTDVDPNLLQDIRSIDLPNSYGTKIDTLGRHLHWIRAHDPGAKSIVFSQYREFLDILSSALTAFKILHTRLGSRGDAAETFKRDPSIDCLLLDAKTDSSGLTLVPATHVFICEPLIHTAIELQAIARVHRIGQTRPTTVWMYLVDDTVEQSIYDISVERRLQHVRARAETGSKSRSATPGLQQGAMEAADSEEMQAQPLSKLLVAGSGDGERVEDGELWQCLFGRPGKGTYLVGEEGGLEVEAAVGRQLRAGAAEARAGGALDGKGGNSR